LAYFEIEKFPYHKLKGIPIQNFQKNGHITNWDIFKKIKKWAYCGWIGIYLDMSIYTYHASIKIKSFKLCKYERKCLIFFFLNCLRSPLKTKRLLEGGIELRLLVLVPSSLCNVVFQYIIIIHKRILF